MSSRFAWLLGLLWLPLASLASTATSENPAAAWRDFLANGAALEPAQHFPYEDCFRQAAARHGLPLVLLLAVARGESDFDPLARSDADAYGLMQILWPQTARHLGIQERRDLLQPCLNVDAGARYLKQLLTQYDDNVHLALAAYNYGPGRVPADGKRVPRGAEWYSGYIHRHLRYVIGEGSAAPGEGDGRYESERKLELIGFDRPYRASAFVAALQAKSPALRLDWFRVSDTRYKVVLLYQGNAELRRAHRLLASAGYRMP